jgi:NAD(P)-dependent dehydrogenase (short-subunit alcohol dehydrogenase family)
MPDGGAIIFNASISGLASEDGFADYSASKGGQILLARTMANELGRRGFWVPIVCPGYVRTPQVDKYLDDPEIAADIVSHIPIGRVGTAEEIAHLVSFLAEPRGRLPERCDHQRRRRADGLSRQRYSPGCRALRARTRMASRD